MSGRRGVELKMWHKFLKILNFIVQIKGTYIQGPSVIFLTCLK
jgi:hypothetical protein